MKLTGENEKFKIKVNRIPSENEKLYPYSKYLKNNYSQLSKIAPKNSILYKLKINPDIVINEYHQTSNNINTNINIKTNSPQNQKNNNNKSRNIISFSGQPNNFSFKKYCDDEKSAKDENNNSNKTKLYEKIIQNNDNSAKLNVSDKRNNDEKNNRELLSPFSIGNNSNNKTSHNKRKINCIRDIKYYNLEKNNETKEYNYIFQNPLNDTRNNKKIKYSNTERYFYNNNSTNNFVDNDNNNINKKYLYANYSQNSNEQNKNYSLDIINTSNALNYKRFERQKSPSINIYNFIEKANSLRADSSIESLRVKKMKEMNDIILSSGNRLTNIFGNIPNNKNNNTSNNNTTNNNTLNNNTDNDKDVLNLKLENYRMKLFKEFMKHFMFFIDSFIRKNFNFFLKKFRIYKYKKEHSYIYNKKNFFSNTIDNVKQRQTYLIKKKNRKDFDLLDTFKSSTVNDYYKYYNNLKKNKNVNPNLKQIFSSSLINKEINESKMSPLLNKSLSNYFNNQSLHISSVPRIYNNENNISVKKIQRKKGRAINSKSPSFRFGNSTIVNNDISFGNGGNQKENELYRDSKELNKKYEQIQRRKKKSQNKVKNINQIKENNMNKSVDVLRIKNSDEYNEFNKIRKHLKLSKKDNSKNKNTLNADRYIRDKTQKNNFIKNNSYEDNICDSENNNDDNNQNSNNYNTINNKNSRSNICIYNNEYKTYNYKKNKDTKKDSNEIYNKKKERMPIIQKKTTEIAQQKIKLLNKKQNGSVININNANKKKQNNNQKDKFYMNQNYKTVNRQKDQIKNQNNYSIIKQLPKVNNQILNRHNIYYSKKNTANNFNISTIIKNIVTIDNRIHINIKYFKYSTKNIYLKKDCNSLQISENISICLLGEESNSNLSKLHSKLYPIKEEDTKFYDETGTFGPRNNPYEIRRNYIICNQNELIFKKFVDIIEQLLKHSLKKFFFERIKSINHEDKRKNSEKDLRDQNKDKKARKIYIKKGAINNKIIIEVNDNMIKFFNKMEKKYEKKLENFRIKLIRYFFGFSQQKI